MTRQGLDHVAPLLRDRSVRAAIALSYELLDETTRRVFKYAHAARNATVTAAALGYCLELDPATAEDGLNSP